jgi:hypothetical protein
VDKQTNATQTATKLPTWLQAHNKDMALVFSPDALPTKSLTDPLMMESLGTQVGHMIMPASHTIHGPHAPKSFESTVKMRRALTHMSA